MMTRDTRSGAALGVEASAGAQAPEGAAAEDLASQLFERYQGEIFAYVLRMLGDREWAQDVAQETFLNAHRARNQIAGLDNARAWLYRIASNLALNELRRRNRFAWLPWHWHEEQPETSDVAEEIDRQTLIEKTLAAIPPDYRAPLLLYAHYGFRVAEVAEALNVSEGAARMRLQRAREMFRKAYRKEDQA